MIYTSDQHTDKYDFLFPFYFLSMKQFVTV